MLVIDIFKAKNGLKPVTAEEFKNLTFNFRNTETLIRSNVN